MKIGYSKLFISLLIIILGFASCQSSQDKINLRLNLNPGEKYKYTTLLDQNITSMGMVNIELKFTIDLIYEMLPKENNLQKLAVTYDHLSLQGTNPMGAMSYDSDTPSQNPQINEIGNLVGKTFYVYLNNDGTLNRVEGINKLVDSSMGNGTATLRDSSFRSMMQNAFDVYPGKPVGIGESWKKSSTMGISSFQFNVQHTYTLESVKDGVAHVSVKSALTLPETNLEGKQKVKMEMTGRQKGTMEIEIATGRVISGETTQNIEGEMKAAGQSVPMIIKSTIHTTSKRS